MTRAEKLFYPPPSKASLSGMPIKSLLDDIPHLDLSGCLMNVAEMTLLMLFQTYSISVLPHLQNPNLISCYTPSCGIVSY